MSLTRYDQRAVSASVDLPRCRATSAKGFDKRDGGIEISFGIAGNPSGTPLQGNGPENLL